jgi:hypothetical protein
MWNVSRGSEAAEDDALFCSKDIEVYDNIGKLRENDSGYNYFVIHKDLYTILWRRNRFFCPNSWNIYF